MIVDQHCQCNAPEARAFVSSYPEFFVANEPVDSETNNVPKEFDAFFGKMDRCQQTVHNSRFRCYGEVRPDNSHCMVLVTEFREFKDNEEFWRNLEAVQRATEAHVWIMEDDVENERYAEYDGGGLVGETYGPNHGRPFMQVELSWRIEKLSYVEIKELSDRMDVATHKLWESAGVGVC